MRRDLGVIYKNATPPLLREFILERNMKKYSDPLGSTFEYLVNIRGRTLEQIAKSSSRVNQDIEAELAPFESWLRSR